MLHFLGESNINIMINRGFRTLLNMGDLTGSDRVLNTPLIMYKTYMLTHSVQYSHLFLCFADSEESAAEYRKSLK